MDSSSCDGVPPSAYLSYLTAAISIFLAIVTIPGNSLVCLAIIKDPFRELRTPFNYFLFSLAATDLMVGTVMDTISAIFHISEGLELTLVDIRIIHILYFIFCTASILTLAALTVDRYYAVLAPVKYRTQLTPRRAFVASIVIWVVAFGASMLYFKLGFIFYSLIFASTSVFCTAVILCFVYASIYKKLRVQINIRGRGAVTTTEERRKRRRQLRNMKAESKATKALVLVLLTFLLCFTPACVMIYMLNFCTVCDCLFVHWLRDLQMVIVLLNSGINPYVYAWRLPRFKRAFHKLLHLRSWARTNKTSFNCSRDPYIIYGRKMSNGASQTNS